MFLEVPDVSLADVDTTDALVSHLLLADDFLADVEVTDVTEDVDFVEDCNFFWALSFECNPGPYMYP